MLYTPSQLQLKLTVIDPKQIGYLGLLENPIIQLLLCLSLTIMLCGIHYVHKIFNEGQVSYTNLHTVLFILILGLLGISSHILWLNWTYIHSSFTSLMSMLLYESYNPKSVPIANKNDYISFLLHWTFAISPAKVTLGLLLIPLLIPLFYGAIKIKRVK